MKLLLVVWLACCVQAVSAQFAGKLTYKVINSSSTLYMTYYQNGNNARVDARSVASGDTTKVINVQDTLLFDIAGKKTTHLQYKTGNAYVMQNTATQTEQIMAARGMQQQELTVTSAGSETVNGYSCTHYVVTGGMGHASSKREVWVTTSLGTPGIQVAGSYLYWTPDFPQEIKLLAAGGGGVVVKSVISAGPMTTTMNLIGVDKAPPGAGMFTVPARYTVVDRTNMTVPAKP